MHRGNRRRQRQKENDDGRAESPYQRFNRHSEPPFQQRCGVDFGNNRPQRKSSATKHRGQLHVEAGGCSRARCSSASAANSESTARATSSSFRGGTEHEAWFREDTEVIDFFAPPREDFLLGGKPAYMSEG